MNNDRYGLPGMAGRFVPAEALQLCTSGPLPDQARCFGVCGLHAPHDEQPADGRHGALFGGGELFYVCAFFGAQRDLDGPCVASVRRAGGARNADGGSRLFHRVLFPWTSIDSSEGKPETGLLQARNETFLSMERQPEEKQGVTATEIVARMKEAAGVSSVAELSKFVGYRSNAIQNTVSRGHVPFKEAAMVSDKTGVSLDWLVFGAGSKSPKRVAEEPARYDAPQVSRGLLIQSIQEVLDAAPKGRRRGGGPSVADIAETIAWIYEDYLAEQREQRARHRDAASLLRLVVNR